MTREFRYLNNRYRIVQTTKVDRFSMVFLGVDMYQHPPRKCAIEMFKPLLVKPQLIEKFQQQAAILKKLSLMNSDLPQIYNYFYQSEACYLVREFIEGTNLQQKVITNRKLSVDEVKTILVKLLRILDYLHRGGIFHQNIQPESIILREDDCLPMLVDFGCFRKIMAEIIQGKSVSTRISDRYGYSPPEQVIDRATEASDIYSLGLTAIYLLTKKHPSQLKIHLSAQKLCLPEEIKALDRNLATIIDRAISLVPSDRYKSAAQMLAVLQQEINTSKTPRKFWSFLPQYFTKNKSQTNKTTTQPDRPLSPLLFLGLGIIGITALILTDLWQQQWLESVSDAPPQENNYDWSAEFPSVPIEEDALDLELDAPSPPTSAIKVPIFVTGSQKSQFIQALGEPSSIQKGYWENSVALVYQDVASGFADLGYLFDKDTERLRQTEVALAQSLDLEVMQNTLSGLLKGKITPAISAGLKRIYQRQDNLYSFTSGDLKGVIQRDEKDQIYIGIWEADFH